MSARREVKSFCRICAGGCGTVVTVDESDRIVKIRGDMDHPLTQGYACVKGLNVHEAHYGPSRITHPLKRQPDGSFARIGLVQALDEIAAKMDALRKEHGPETIAVYTGSQNATHSAAQPMPAAFVRALGSHGYYSSLTVDQSAKIVAAERMGVWLAGKQDYAGSEVTLLFGINPLVSVYAVNGMPIHNPLKRIKEARARGQRLIIVDPRRTETAHFADVHLQPRPGEDAAIAGGMLRMILAEGWEDKEFCARWVADLEDLRAAVEPFTPEYVAARAGIDAGDLARATELFATARSGTAGSGTGPNMAPFSNLAVHLIEALNVVCGRFRREGDPIPNPGLLTPRTPLYAEAMSAGRSFAQGHKSSAGYGTLVGEMMSCVLADEIQSEGPQKVRALLAVGGNPADAFPDQRGTDEALRSLELMVTIDPYMSRTAQLAHYILPPPLLYERADISWPYMEKMFLPVPFAQYTPAVARVPEDAEVADDQTIIWELARRLGLQLEYAGVPLDMERAPTVDELFDLQLRPAPLSVDDFKDIPGGRIWEVPPMVVQPAREGAAGRFTLMSADVAEEAAAYLADGFAADERAQRYPFLLCSRRIRESMNSSYRELPSIRRRIQHNPLWMHPEDIAALGLAPQRRVRITSSHDAIEAIVEPDETQRRGVVSMTHGWGGDTHATGVNADMGASVNRLVSRTDREPINAMARFSGIRVSITAV